MRLIDADEIIKETYGVVIEDMFHMHETVEVVSTIDIENAPTVKAIPIEWIEEWLDKTTGTRDGEDISQLPEQLKFAIQMINLMEMDWEKENGNDI